MQPKWTVLAVFALIRMRQEGTLESDAARWLEQESGRQGQEFHPEGPEIVAGVYHPDETAARAMPGDPVFAGATGQFGRPEPGHGDFEQPSRIPFDPTGQFGNAQTVGRGEFFSPRTVNHGDIAALDAGLGGVTQTSDLDPITGQRMTRPLPEGRHIDDFGRRAVVASDAPIEFDAGGFVKNEETPLTADQIAALGKGRRVTEETLAANIVNHSTTGTLPDRFINDDDQLLPAEELRRLPIPNPNVGHPELPGDRAAALDSGFSPRDVRDVLDPTDNRTTAEKMQAVRDQIPADDGRPKRK